MRIIVGLGNPGKQYEGTGHNIGFDVVDAFAKEMEIQFSKKGFKSVYGTGKACGESVLILKPQTFMNLSGEAVLLAKKKFKDAKILVVVDDIDIEEGSVRYRQNGSGGTHNGLRNIVSLVGEDFERIKLGIGKPKGDLRDFVVEHKLDPNLRKILIEKGVNKIKEWLA